MTTGSWDASIPDNGSRKLVLTKGWVGGDRPKVDYPKAPLRTVTRFSKRQGKFITITFREKQTGVSRPPKRARDVDHDYEMLLTKMSDFKVTYNPSGSRFYVMDIYGVPTWHGWSTQAEAFSDNDLIKLIGKLREKMSGSDFNLGTLLGEGHQTLRMIGDSAISIAKSIHHLKKGDLAGAARSLLEPANRKPIRPYKEMKPFRPTSDAMSSKWLELQYGWRPLLGDAKAGAEFIAHKLSVPAKQVHRMSISKHKNQTRVSELGNPGGPVTANSFTTARLALKVTVSEPQSTMAALGLLNPEVVAWELMPWSFVVDWFLPIGDYLSARATLSNITISQSVLTCKIVSTQEAPEQGGILSGDFSQAGYKRVYLKRVVTQGAPKLPLPGFKPLSEALSVQHCLNGIALLAQTVSGRSKKREREQALSDKLPPSNPNNGIIPSASETLGRKSK